MSRKEVARLRQELAQVREELAKLQVQAATWQHESNMAKNHAWSRHRKVGLSVGEAGHGSEAEALESAEEASLNLPVPRLQLTYKPGLKEPNQYGQHEVIVEYALVTKHLLDHLIVIPLGSTTCMHVRRGGLAHDHRGEMYIPFRDGAHIHHDARLLKLPAFAFHDGQVLDLVAHFDRLDAERAREREQVGAGTNVEISLP